MMKAIIVDIEGDYAVALDKRGRFIKIEKTVEHTVGYEIDVPSKVSRFSNKTLLKIMSVAAVLLLVSSISFAAYSYNTPYCYVNVDINPSLEIVLNMYNRIIDVKALNPEGEKLIEDSYKNSRLDEGVKKIIDSAVAQGFLTSDDENAVMLTVAGKNYEKVLKIKEEVGDTANKALTNDKVVSEVIVENVVLERREEAKELGVSPGKLVLIDKLKEVNPEATTDEYKDKPVKEIMKSIKDRKKVKEENNLKDINKDNNKDKVNSEPTIEPLPTKKPDAEISVGEKNSISPARDNKPDKANSNTKINNDINKDNTDNKANSNTKTNNDVNKDNKDGKANSNTKINNDINKDNKDIKNNTNNNDKPNNQDNKDTNNKDKYFQYNPYWNPNCNPYWAPNSNPYWEKPKEKVDEEQKKPHNEWTEKIGEDQKKPHNEWTEKIGEEQKKQYNEWIEKMGEEQKKQYDEWAKKIAEEQKKQYDEWIKKTEEMKRIYEESKEKEAKDKQKENKPDKPYHPGKDNMNRKKQ
ncbi:anti-sigma factor domain-containing protein [Acetivibrio mesophilus]|nr:anti-sigma factor domain-containing protein [Acetivibrio mesophilus]